MVLTGRMPNNLKFCDYASPSLGWYAPGGTFVGNDAGLVAGKAYLNCGKWYVPNWTSDLSCVGAGFPRANCPFAASQANPYNFPGSDDPTWDDAAIDVTNSTSSKDTCADIGKQTVNEANYAALSTVYTNTNQGDLVNGKGMLAIVTDAVMARLETTDSVWNPSGYSKAGFTFGWLDGDGTTGFRIPNDDKKPEYVQLGMRMWNVTNSGGAGSLSGWVMPMRVQMNCYSTGNSGRYIRFTVEMPANAKDRWGMKCSRGGDTVSGQYQVCTIPDGSQYTIALKKRDLQLNPSIEITANTQ